MQVVPIQSNVVQLERAKIYALDDYDFYHILEQTLGASIVFFTKHGCSSCRSWLQLLHDYCRSGHNVKIYTVDAEENMALANEYELFHLPALFLFVDGRYHRELQCEARLPDLIKAIEMALELPAQDAP